MGAGTSGESARHQETFTKPQRRPTKESRSLTAIYRPVLQNSPNTKSLAERTTASCYCAFRGRTHRNFPPWKSRLATRKESAQTPSRSGSGRRKLTGEIPRKPTKLVNEV